MLNLSVVPYSPTTALRSGFAIAETYTTYDAFSGLNLPTVSLLGRRVTTALIFPTEAEALACIAHLASREPYRPRRLRAA